MAVLLCREGVCVCLVARYWTCILSTTVTEGLVQSQTLGHSVDAILLIGAELTYTVPVYCRTEVWNLIRDVNNLLKVSVH